MSQRVYVLGLSQGDPGERLLRVAHLLTSAAERAGSARMAALAARVLQTFALASVCQGVPADVRTAPSRGDTSGVPDCWHLNAPQYAEVVQHCLALAQHHSGLELVGQLQMDLAAAQGVEPGALPWGGGFYSRLLFGFLGSIVGLSTARWSHQSL
jgi:hypothetical protein